MGTQPRMQSDHLERLKRVFEDAPRDHVFLAEYVRELELHRQEEDVFIRLGFRNTSAGGPHGRGDTFITSAYSQLYDEPLDAGQKREARLWWHDSVWRQAERFDDLKARLARLLVEGSLDVLWENSPAPKEHRKYGLRFLPLLPGQHGGAVTHQKPIEGEQRLREYVLTLQDRASPLERRQHRANQWLLELHSNGRLSLSPISITPPQLWDLQASNS